MPFYLMPQVVQEPTEATASAVSLEGGMRDHRQPMPDFSSMRSPLKPHASLPAPRIPCPSRIRRVASRCPRPPSASWNRQPFLSRRSGLRHPSRRRTAPLPESSTCPNINGTATLHAVRDRSTGDNAQRGGTTLLPTAAP
ncbi:unnamed protein product [Cutaneotrichosporon oleaginosum]